ncbi:MULTISPECIES: preprotein translocase subunit SecG [unclassified Rickettsia]|uniref:preprotein translocase subunit SecG n=1 Tax=unclassified Rickettsia TaxID=114295 RepID=UPI00209EC3C0|nr:preprotein translocase subunit SecG [Rickettsia endosymbiont of Ceutorhynchus assimilis]
MINILLFIHIVIAVLLIIVILMQRSGSDGISGLSGGNNMGVVSAKTVGNFLTKSTVVLATLFLVNAIVLANLSSKKRPDLATKINQEVNQEGNSLPIAK